MAATRKEWKILPWPQLGAPFETAEDEEWLQRIAPLSVVQVFVVIGAICIILIGYAAGDHYGWDETWTNLGAMGVLGAMGLIWQLLLPKPEELSDE